MEIAEWSYLPTSNLKERRVSRRNSAPDLTLRPRLRRTRSEIPIQKFANDRDDDKSKNPAHHTSGSNLAPL
jgi:hypothetical protein